MIELIVPFKIKGMARTDIRLAIPASTDSRLQAHVKVGPLRHVSSWFDRTVETIGRNFEIGFDIEEL